MPGQAEIDLSSLSLSVVNTAPGGSFGPRKKDERVSSPPAHPGTGIYVGKEYDGNVILNSRSDMDIEKKTQYQWEYDYLVGQISCICRNCNNPRKKRASMDYQDPMNCTCRCGPIKVIRARIKEIQAILSRDSKSVPRRISVPHHF